MVELMRPSETLTQSEIVDGDIICFQVEISDEEAHDLESRGMYSNPKQFYKFLRNRVTKPNDGEEPSVGPGSPREDRNATPGA